MSEWEDTYPHCLRETAKEDQPMSHTPHCTCRIVQTKTIVSRPLTIGDFAIDQCPLHTAAPELLALVRSYIMTYPLDNMRTKHKP